MLENIVLHIGEEKKQGFTTFSIERVEQIEEFPSGKEWESIIRQGARLTTQSHLAKKKLKENATYTNVNPILYEERKIIILPRKTENNFFDRTYIKKELKKLYRFRNRQKVLYFIEKKVISFDFLLNTHKIIKEFFPESTLYLEVFTDPEGIEEDELVIYIATSLSRKEAVRQLLKFNEKWCLIYSNRDRKKISVDVE